MCRVFWVTAIWLCRALSHQTRRCAKVGWTLGQRRRRWSIIKRTSGQGMGANVGLRLGQGRRRWNNIKPTLDQGIVLAGVLPLSIVEERTVSLSGKIRADWLNVCIWPSSHYTTWCTCMDITEQPSYYMYVTHSIPIYMIILETWDKNRTHHDHHMSIIDAR